MATNNTVMRRFQFCFWKIEVLKRISCSSVLNKLIIAAINVHSKGEHRAQYGFFSVVVEMFFYAMNGMEWMHQKSKENKSPSSSNALYAAAIDVWGSGHGVENIVFRRQWTTFKWCYNSLLIQHNLHAPCPCSVVHSSEVHFRIFFRLCVEQLLMRDKWFRIAWLWAWSRGHLLSAIKIGNVRCRCHCWNIEWINCRQLWIKKKKTWIRRVFCFWCVHKRKRSIPVAVMLHISSFELDSKKPVPRCVSASNWFGQEKSLTKK